MKGTREQNTKAKNVPGGHKSSVSTNNNADEVGKTNGHCLELIRNHVSVKEDDHDSSSKGTANDRVWDPLAPRPRKKIKLQLYPVDEVTRIGLEKEGIHPYLELTLRSTKKISSVLKHIDKKWGSSKIALGKPMLVPYNVHGDISRCRMWTVKNSETSAGDVYVSIGRPENFRLRYGWVQPPELDMPEEPFTSIPYKACLQSNDAWKDNGSDVKIPDKDEVQIEETRGCLDLVNDVKDPINDEVRIGESRGSLNSVNDDRQRMVNQPGQSAAQWNNNISNISIGAFLSETSPQRILNNTDEPRSSENDREPASNSHLMVPSWADSLIDISIGGLLSEESLQGTFNNGNNAKSIMLNGDSLSTQIFSDSLDAFLTARNRSSLGLRPPSHDSQTFILDGEETCHAFPVQKFSSSGKRVSATGGSSGGSSRDSGSRSFKFSKIDEINSLTGVSGDQACEDAQTDQFRSLRTYTDENSLGLANIKWSDSLGPFDLGQPAPRKLNQRENSNSGFIKK